MREFKDPHTPFLVKKSHYLSLTNLKNITNFTAMKTFILIIKGILLYVTILYIILFVTGADSIYDNGYFIYAIIIGIILVLLCGKFISKEDVEVLTFNKYFNEK